MGYVYHWSPSPGRTVVQGLGQNVIQSGQGQLHGSARLFCALSALAGGEPGVPRPAAILLTGETPVLPPLPQPGRGKLKLSRFIREESACVIMDCGFYAW